MTPRFGNPSTNSYYKILWRRHHEWPYQFYCAQGMIMPTGWKMARNKKKGQHTLPLLIASLPGIGDRTGPADEMKNRTEDATCQ